MKRAIFGLTFLTVFSFCLSAYAQDSEFVENPANHGGRIVGDWKYFGRDYIVRNPRATLPEPEGIPLVKMDSTQEECEGWTEDERVTFSELTPYSPRIAVSGDTIHVVWYEYRESFYKRSVNGGMTWEDSVMISNFDEITSMRPDVAVENHNVYLVWEDFCSISQDCGIYFRKSTDGGENWQPIQPVALAGPDYYEYYDPAICAKDSLVFVAFAKNIDSDGSLRFKKSTSFGDSWGTEVLISETPPAGYPPKLVLNAFGLYVVHEYGLRVYCNVSTDWGDTWSDDIFISDMDSSIAQWPSIGADDNGGIYVTWVDYRYSPYGWTGDIFLRSSTDNGESWDSIIVLTDNHLCIESDVSADTSSVHVVWHDERHEANVEIYRRRSTNSGLSWEEEDRLTDAPYGSVDPWITTDKGKLYMTWVDDRDYPEDRRIYFKKGYRYIPGDANSDRTVNIADAVFTVNYLFIGGPAPNVFESGDVNGDGGINLADVVYLVNFLFIGGPPPVEC
jgi:hypothetical protein